LIELKIPTLQSEVRIPLAQLPPLKSAIDYKGFLTLARNPTASIALRSTTGLIPPLRLIALGLAV